MSDLRDKVKNVRRDYDKGELEEKDAPAEPLTLFNAWLNAAIEGDIKEPNAFTLSTHADGKVDSRVVLLRDVSEKGLSFYTNYTSKKAKDIENSSMVAVNFFWAAMDRQIRIQGKVERLPSEQSDAYFASRPRASKIGAWASDQSENLDERLRLEKTVKAFEEKFENTDDIPRPDFWGGYLIRPINFEFWQGRPSRLHDRLVYEEIDGKWSIKRLYP